MLNKMNIQTNIEFNFFGKGIKDRFFNRGKVIMKKSLVSSPNYSTSKMTTKKQGLSFIPFLGSDPYVPMLTPYVLQTFYLKNMVKLGMKV